MSNDLRGYRGKRNFGKTAEPRGERGKTASGASIFVVHKHDASSLHYDFRIEVGSTLRSWAVPKGPSTDPRDRQLALVTEDHPLEYADFEGVIPEGEYGAGTVLVWDTGKFRALGKSDDRGVAPAEALNDGHLSFWLEGQKIRGGYALTRIGGADGQRWLLVKADDEGADRRRNPVNTEPRSVLSGKNLPEIAKEYE